MLSLPGSEDHSTSGNRLFPGIVIDDKEDEIYACFGHAFFIFKYSLLLKQCCAFYLNLEAGN